MPTKNLHIWEKYAVKSESRTYDGIALFKHALVNTTPDITKKIKIDDKEVKVRDMEANSTGKQQDWWNTQCFPSVAFRTESGV